MRDYRDYNTADIWDHLRAHHREPTSDAPVGDVTYLSDRPPSKPRVRCVDDRVTLIGHPHLPDMGIWEIKRMGSITAVLRSRMKYHQQAAAAHTFHSSPELPARRSREQVHNSVLVIRYRDALEEFTRAEERARHGHKDNA